MPLHLIGSHGQTVYHEHSVTTLQLGEPAPLAARFGCPVAHDFRANDIVAGGAGAPLVPYVDWRLLAGRGEALLAVNIGGIANLTALPRNGGRDQVLGMDCGPGNMVLDQLVEAYSGGRQAIDIDGKLAARGRLLPLLKELEKHPFFHQPPPKSAGREQFGSTFVRRLLDRARRWRAGVVRPAGDRDRFTAYGIETAYRRHVAPGAGGCGRGERWRRATRPHTRLAARFAPVPVRPVTIRLADRRQEAIAFAILHPSASTGVHNMPSVTGAARCTILGKITES
jgi:anhydro-N-acetylmuramic acid kinase